MAGETAAPVAPVPATGSPAARAPVVPAKVVAPVAAPPVAPPVDFAAEAAKAKAEAANAKKFAESRLQMQKKAHDAEKKTFGEKLSRLAAYEKSDKEAELNPAAYAEQKWGKDWYDKLTEIRVNGGAPTANTVALELAKMEERFEAKLKAKDEEFEKRQQSSQAQSVDVARRQLAHEGVSMWKAKSAKFPLVSDLGSPEDIGAELARRVEMHYLQTTQRDEAGNIIADGEVMPLTRVAESWENSLVAIAEKAAAHQMYAEKFKPKSQTVAPKDEVQLTRRTLSNDLTGSTQSQKPPMSDAERRERSVAAWQNARKPKT
jgi:hypothetical protein